MFLLKFYLYRTIIGGKIMDEKNIELTEKLFFLDLPPFCILDSNVNALFPICFNDILPRLGLGVAVVRF